MRGWLIAAVLAALLLAGAPAAAITNGEPDGTAHPYVGLVVFYDAQDLPLWRCSGALLSSTVLLTAGHCAGADPTGWTPTSAQVWFVPGPIPMGPLGKSPPGTPCTGFTGYPCTGGTTGTPYPHPEFGAGFPNTRDIGVVVLDTPVTPGTYAALPTAGFLDALATKRGQQDTSFTVVGYGLQEVKPVFSNERTRYVGTVQLQNLRSALTDGFNLQTTSSPGKGHGSGGTCFGDSGGPVLHSTTNVVVAVTSFGLNALCKGADFAYRTDISTSRSFLTGFGVTVP